MLVSGGTRTVERYAATRYRGRLGVLLTPAAGNSADFALRLGLPWAADNAAFSGFDEAAFVRLLDRINGKPGCLWVACPDVVCDARATLDLFGRWEPVVRARGAPVALVAQNGLTADQVPWERVDCLFVGGDDPFKDGPEGRGLARAARDRGKAVHVGRVNSERRLALYAGLADSFDGTGVSIAPDTNLPKVLRWIGRTEHRHNHPALFE